MPTERPARRIEDVLANITAIESYTGGLTKDAFACNRMAVDAVERCLERISEAARKLGEQFDSRVPDDVDLASVRRFGSVLRHDYDAVDTDILWNVVTLRLPALKTAFEKLEAEHPLPAKDTETDFDPFRS